MPIIRCSDQKVNTLEEFYFELTSNNNNIYVDVGTSMLLVLKLVNETFKETTIYGLTSLYKLIFLSKDTYKSPWFVSIGSSGDEFHIEYLMTINKQPWLNASVKGATKSLEELKKLIIIAMKESEGWEGSEELKQLHKHIST